MVFEFQRGSGKSSVSAKDKQCQRTNAWWSHRPVLEEGEED